MVAMVPKKCRRDAHARNSVMTKLHTHLTFSYHSLQSGENDHRVNDKLKFMSQLKRNEMVLSHVVDDVDGGAGPQRKLEGMRDGDDAQDDVFIVELDKKNTGIGLGLIDGLVRESH